jgi:hypothetical protein
MEGRAIEFWAIIRNKPAAALPRKAGVRTK